MLRSRDDSKVSIRLLKETEEARQRPIQGPSPGKDAAKPPLVSQEGYQFENLATPRWAQPAQPGPRWLRFLSNPGWAGKLIGQSLRCYAVCATLIFALGALWWQSELKTTLNAEYCTTWPLDQLGRSNLDSRPRHENEIALDSFAPERGWKKSDDVRVVGLVFFKHRRTTDILDCYLRQNLATNGGYLDKVQFMVQTEDETDRAWLRDMVADERSYEVIVPPEYSKQSSLWLWSRATEDHTVYIKMDDEVVYIHPDAIPQLVHTRIAVTHPFAVSANLANDLTLGMQHYHFGAIHPFLPDLSPTPWALHDPRRRSEAWRPTEWARYPRNAHESDYAPNRMQAPYRGHPWLLVSERQSALPITPMGKLDGTTCGGELPSSWGVVAQQLYSLLHNIEQNALHKYFFGRPIAYPTDLPGPNATATAVVPPPFGGGGPGGEQTYDTQFRPHRFDFVALWGSDVREQLLPALLLRPTMGDCDDDDDDDDDDDGFQVLADMPRRTRRTFLIDTRSVVARMEGGGGAADLNSHGRRNPEGEGGSSLLASTDLLDRFRGLANEIACSAGNLKMPADSRCPAFLM